MEVALIFYGILKRYSRSENGKESICVAEGAKIRDVLDEFRIIPGELALILINSDSSKENAVLKNGDTVELFPICGGG